MTVPSKSDVQVTCPLPLNCLVLIQSLTFLNKLYVGFIDSSSTSTNVSVDTVIDNSYMVVYSWDSEQSIFDGNVSLITQLHSPTSKYVSIILIRYKHLIDNHAVIPTSVFPTNPPPGTVSQTPPLPTEAIAGTRTITMNITFF